MKSFDSLDSFLSCTSRHEAEAFSFSVMNEEAVESVKVFCVDTDALGSTDFLDFRSLCGGGPMSQCEQCDMVEVLIWWAWEQIGMVEVLACKVFCVGSRACACDGDLRIVKSHLDAHRVFIENRVSRQY